MKPKPAPNNIAGVTQILELVPDVVGQSAAMGVQSLKGDVPGDIGVQQGEARQVIDYGGVPGDGARVNGARNHGCPQGFGHRRELEDRVRIDALCSALRTSRRPNP